MDRKMKNKKGFGITEVLISAMVLGLLYMAILHMQTGNREALLRIRGRDGATEVAQNMIESLGAQGLSSYTDASTKLLKTASNVLYVKERSFRFGNNKGELFFIYPIHRCFYV